MCAMERKRLRSMAVNATGLASELSQIGRQCLSAWMNAKMRAFPTGSFLKTLERARRHRPPPSLGRAGHLLQPRRRAEIGPPRV